ncbi:hypothetical protein [Escherichia coli]
MITQRFINSPFRFIFIFKAIVDETVHTLIIAKRVENIADALNIFLGVARTEVTDFSKASN